MRSGVTPMRNCGQLDSRWQLLFYMRPSLPHFVLGISELHRGTLWESGWAQQWSHRDLKYTRTWRRWHHFQGKRYSASVSETWHSHPIFQPNCVHEIRHFYYKGSNLHTLYTLIMNTKVRYLRNPKAGIRQTMISKNMYSFSISDRCPAVFVQYPISESDWSTR